MASVQDACQTTDGSPDRAAARGRPLTKGELDLCVTALRRVHAFASRAALRARFAVQQRRADEKWVYGAADRVDLVAVGLVRIRQPTESRHGRAAARSELRQAHGISGSLRNGNAILGWEGLPKMARTLARASSRPPTAGTTCVHELLARLYRNDVADVWRSVREHSNPRQTQDSCLNSCAPRV